MNRLLVFIIIFMLNLIGYMLLNKYLYIFLALIINDMLFRLINEYFHNTQLTYLAEDGNIVVVYFKNQEDKQKFIESHFVGEEND